jgi:hypothetical protein
MQSNSSPSVTRGIQARFTDSNNHSTSKDLTTQRSSYSSDSGDDEFDIDFNDHDLNWEDSGKLLVLSKILPLWHNEGLSLLSPYKDCRFYSRL